MEQLLFASYIRPLEGKWLAPSGSSVAFGAPRVCLGKKRGDQLRLHTLSCNTELSVLSFDVQQKGRKASVECNSD